MTTALSVNLNKIALLRNSREGNYPNVVSFANAAIEAGANGITVHPRPDQRHIRPNDVIALQECVQQYDSIELNIEGNPFEEGNADYPGLLSLVDNTRADQATLVPDSNNQLTSDHGFDLVRDGERLLPVIQTLKSWGVRVSLFMDPDLKQIEHAKRLGADRIELYTGPYAKHYNGSQHRQQLALYRKAARYALEIGLTVNAGHDLNLENLAEFLQIADIAEVSIGHALTVDALIMGYSNAVAAYSNICQMN